MATIINDDFQACGDCTPVLANGDYTHLDYYYDEAEAEAVMARINQGMDEAGGYIAYGDRDKDIDFSRRRCDCCGSTLHGQRTHFVVLN